MPKDRTFVRASEIGMWSFCQRAWWLAQVKGAQHRNPERLQHGQAVHQAHGRSVLRADWLTRVGLTIIVLAFLLLGLLIVFVLWSA
jgi:hypothetical protein